MSNRFQIWIKDNEGNRTQIRVTKDMQIKEVKELFIQSNPEMGDYKTLELFFNGNQLNDNQTLGELKIRNGKTLVMLDVDELIKAAFLNKFY